MKRIAIILFSLPLLSLTSCSWEDIKDKGPQAAAFGQCSSAAVLKCYEDVYGGDVTLEEVRLLSEME